VSELGEHSEAMARALVERLISAGAGARARGAGLHWQVEAESGERGVVVHCFWYERVTPGAMLGMNPGNGRQRQRARWTGYEGPQYLVILQHRGRCGRVADGRTYVEAEAVACVRRWLDGTSLDDLVRESPFIDKKPRAMRAIARQLASGLRWDVEAEPGCALWVYGGDRSCKLSLNGEAVSCACWIGQAQVAFGDAIADLPAAVAAWLIERMPVTRLASSVPGIELEPHVEWIELEPARWHWLHVRERLADPDDVLAPSRELIEALAASPIAASFYTYSSLYWFCFSASSHFPWVDAGLPRVLMLPDGQCTVDDVPCNLVTAVERVERALAAYPVRPFFGSAVHHQLPAVVACLRGYGSALEPELIQRDAWYRLEIAQGGRWCEVNHLSVRFVDGPRGGQASYATLGDAVQSIRWFLEDDVSLEVLVPAADRS
jgi:hypothetical protein